MTETLPLLATRALARRVDGAEISFCGLAGAREPEGIASLIAGGGRALYGSPGSPLNKVLGLGLEDEVSDGDLDRIEAFYAERESPVQIELCPLAEADVASRLCARGYVVQGFENELARYGGAATSTDASDVRVAPASTAEDDDLWIRITAEGFAAAETAGPDAAIDAGTLETMSQMMREFRHPAITHYLAWIGDQPAGGAATYLHDAVLGIFGTATHPRFRRRGVQAALVAQALADQLEQADFAIATTAPGSTSQRTFERCGFQVIYTRIVFVKPFLAA